MCWFHRVLINSAVNSKPKPSMWKPAMVAVAGVLAAARNSADPISSTVSPNSAVIMFLVRVYKRCCFLLTFCLRCLPCSGSGIVVGFHRG